MIVYVEKLNVNNLFYCVLSINVTSLSRFWKSLKPYSHRTSVLTLLIGPELI